MSDASYQLHPLQGMCLKQISHGERDRAPSISGKVLLQLAAGQYTDKECLKVAKYMARANLDQLLGGKPLQSRNLFHTIVKK